MDALEIVAHCRDRLGGSTDADLIESIGSIEREPGNPDRFYHLAEVCRAQGHDDIWREALNSAFGLPHVTHRQVFRRGEAKVILGDWSGWHDREARLFDPAHDLWHSEYCRTIRWAERQWDGKESLDDKTLFLIADGSHSDCLQMLRYVPTAASVASRVILGVSPELLTLARHNFASLVTVTFREVEHAVAFERYAWTMSLPALHGAPPPFVPLRAPRPASRAALDERLQVGICWAGRKLDMPLDVLQPLLARDDVQWHSLQVGDRARDAADYQSLIQPPRPFYTFADTANYMRSLDCVVSISTAVAHLAGALDLPTFVMLTRDADSRWGLGDTTPWYPSMRLVRQQMLGDWAYVVKVVGAELDSRGT